MGRASIAGAKLDSALLKGGGTDDTTVLQRLLDRANTGRPVHLILDGERFRGIGIRLEDNVAVTADGCDNYSAILPSGPDEVERWIAELQGGEE